MNKYEERAARERKAALRNAMTLWTAGLVLVAVVFVIVGLSSGASSDFWKRAALILAVLLLILRQVGRRLRGRTPRAAEPDPRSRLKLQ
jgi:hypothetical protein